MVEEYDPVMDTWKRKADIPTRRQFPSACAVNGKIYTIGGGHGQSFSTVEEYTPEDWQPKAVSPQGKIPTKWGEVKSD